MGIRSDVGVAVKAEVHERFEQEALPLVGSCLKHAGSHEEGDLYVVQDVKWYESDPGVKAFYKKLEELGDENFSVVEACHDFPDSDYGDFGGWMDNPFMLYRVVNVELHYLALDRDNKEQ